MQTSSQRGLTSIKSLATKFAVPTDSCPCRCSYKYTNTADLRVFHKTEQNLILSAFKNWGKFPIYLIILRMARDREWEMVRMEKGSYPAVSRRGKLMMAMDDDLIIFEIRDISHIFNDMQKTQKLFSLTIRCTPAGVKNNKVLVWFWPPLIKLGHLWQILNNFATLVYRVSICLLGADMGCLCMMLRILKQTTVRRHALSLCDQWSHHYRSK